MEIFNIGVLHTSVHSG